jgi:hypothetical protein
MSERLPAKADDDKLKAGSAKVEAAAFKVRSPQGDIGDGWSRQ